MNKNEVKIDKKPDWERFGLSNEQQEENDKGKSVDGVYQSDSQTNELFNEDQSAKSKAWWLSTFFITERVLFGTWDGVFTSCMINIFGVVIFLRTGWMVGNAGIGLSTLIILLTISLALIAILSAIGVCERCKMESGGVYFLISHVLGARIGASVGILYCFGQSVACSLYVVGFGESIAALFHLENEWIAKSIGIGVVLLLLAINIAGVKWVIRLQLVLLIILFIAVLDFLVGSFVHTQPESGFMGYSGEILRNNTAPNYLPGENFFTVFGVFFPTATGVMAGINMSGDLRHPAKNIPIGTLSSVGVSSFLYLSFTLVLGATCLRDVLQEDYMIAEKVSIVGALFLCGLYISSISSCMGGLYAAPRILQCIALENVLPIFKFLGHGVSIIRMVWLCGLYVASLSGASGSSTGSLRILFAIANSGAVKPLKYLQFTVKRGPNKVPVYALLVVTLITLLFILIGDVNTLGPIVTMPFMVTYAAVDYTYFSLAMSFDKISKREKRSDISTAGYGAIQKTDDLDKLFPERNTDNANNRGSRNQDEKVVVDDTAGLLDDSVQRLPSSEITQQPRSFYSFICNRWVSLFGVFACLVIMIAIQWIYALCNLGVLLIIFIYIGQANPGVFPGIAEFGLLEWLISCIPCVNKEDKETMIIQPSIPNLHTKQAQLTEDNEDFAERGRYHQSEVVKGENFDDYD